MQTFLPSRSFRLSAEYLDNKRLGKQRVEVLQILKVLNDETMGWKNHPTVKMWQGYTNALVWYGLVICREWHDKRKFKDTCAEKIKKYFLVGESVLVPDWVSDKAVHSSHRAALLAKNPEWYSRFGWKEKPDAYAAYAAYAATDDADAYAYAATDDAREKAFSRYAKYLLKVLKESPVLTPAD